MSSRIRRLRALLTGLVVLGALGVGAAVGQEEPPPEPPPPPAVLDPTQDAVVEARPLADQVELRIHEGPGPVHYRVIEVGADAAVGFQAISAAGRVGVGRETVSSMCKRTGSLACVNANFPICPRCDPPHGAVIRKRMLLRTPTDHQYQVFRQGGRWRSEPWAWSAELQALGPDPLLGLGAPEVVATFPIDGINEGPGWHRSVLHTKHWGPSTGAKVGSLELRLRMPAPIWTGGSVQDVEVVGLTGDGDAAIPSQGAVLTTRGDAVARLKDFLRDHADRTLRIASTTPPITAAVAAHPVLLDAGARPYLDPADGKVTRRHPRTLLGWDDAGRTWLVVVDGRQPDHSIGMTLHESTNLLAHLGATHGVNLDGGGSSAMATFCNIGTGWCLENRPSGGVERRVWVGLAIVER